jgi:uncharacterized protein YrrD
MRGLLRLPVRTQGIELGYVVDVIVDPDSERVLGLDVLCRDQEHRFLPLAAATIGKESIDVASSLHLLDLDEGSFYRRKATSLRSRTEQET